MKGLYISTDTSEKLFPDKITDAFSIKKLLSINHHNAIFHVVSKSSNKNYIIKVLDKRYYDKKLYQQIFQLKNSFLLLPETYFSNHSFCYFLYPQYITLSEWLSTKCFTYQMLRRIISEIGTAITNLHEHKIAHLDISPNNIYINEDKHFLLGDFSSSRYTSGHLSFLFSSALRTGYSPLFSKNFTLNDTITLFEIDCLSFCMLIYLLSNNGIFPDKDITYSDNFYTLHSFLNKKISPDSFQKTNNIKELLKELKKIMTLCDKDTNCQNFSLQISEKQCIKLFEATLECDKSKKSVFQNKKFISYPFSSPAPLYGCLILCGFIFLFSLYHYLLQNNTVPKNNIILPTDYQTKISNASKTAAPFHLEKDDSPQNTIYPSPDKKGDSAVENTLNISGKKRKAALLKEEFKNHTSLQILFANSCELSDCSFLLFSPKLKELYLHNNSLNSLEHLKSLKELQILVLSKNHLTDVSPLASLNSLTMLDLSYNSRLKNINSLASLTKLHYLVLTNTNITKKEAVFLQKKLPHCTIFY